MTLSTYDAIARAPRRTFHWSILSSVELNSSGAGYSVLGSTSAGGGVWGNSQNYIPFPSSAATTGENPTSYTFGGLQFDALDADAFLIDGGASSTQGVDNAWLGDVLWSGPIVTTVDGVASTFTPPTLPARDGNGSSDGVGVLAGLWTTSFGAGITASISYTNSDGTSGRTSGSVSGGASSSGGPWRLPLQAGDKGVRSVQSITTVGGSIVCRVALWRRLGSLINPSRHIPVLTRIPSGAMLFPLVAYSSLSTVTNIHVSAQLAMDY